MSDIAEQLLLYRRDVDIQWGVLYDKIGEAADEIKRLRSALEEISLGKGPYNRNPLIHAENIIEDMKAIAIGALNGTWKPEADGGL
ncbi:MAG TPA: hypothetical protein VMW79_07970 [Anaerolineae bacterium]|nr:hypothetical protein [Anaerolineae bacterium]